MLCSKLQEVRDEGELLIKGRRKSLNINEKESITSTAVENSTISVLQTTGDHEINKTLLHEI